MSSNPLIPDPSEQAEAIFADLTEGGADLGGLEPADLEEFIDPEQPIWKNLRPVAEAIGAVEDTD